MNSKKHNFKEVELVQMLRFRALPIEEKLKAVEDMCDTSDYLLKKAAERRKAASQSE